MWIVRHDDDADLPPPACTGTHHCIVAEKMVWAVSMAAKCLQAAFIRQQPVLQQLARRTCCATRASCRHR